MVVLCLLDHILVNSRSLAAVPFRKIFAQCGVCLLTYTYRVGKRNNSHEQKTTAFTHAVQKTAPQTTVHLDGHLEIANPGKHHSLGKRTVCPLLKVGLGTRAIPTSKPTVGG